MNLEEVKKLIIGKWRLETDSKYRESTNPLYEYDSETESYRGDERSDLEHQRRGKKEKYFITEQYSQILLSVPGAKEETEIYAITDRYMIWKIRTAFYILTRTL
jgi:hypothetical protein